MADVKKFGAKGDGKADDTSAIQLAIDDCPKDGVVTVPEGKYMINAEKGLRLKSDMTFKMFAGAELHVIPNNLWRYSVLSIHNVSNVTVLNGKLVGDRINHTPKLHPNWTPSKPWNKYGEWGMGVDIRGSKDVLVQGTEVRSMWGDGFYIQDKGDNKAEHIALRDVRAVYNRRQGCSVIAVSGLRVLNSVFRDTKGTRPAAGIDFEPDLKTPKNVIEDVLIQSSRFYNNQGAGIEFAVKKGIVRNVRVTGDNKFGGNDKSIKSSTFSWWQNIWYSIFGWPESIKL